jgi:hypothetical protein
MECIKRHDYMEKACRFMACFFWIQELFCKKSLLQCKVNIRLLEPTKRLVGKIPVITGVKKIFL